MASQKVLVVNRVAAAQNTLKKKQGETLATVKVIGPLPDNGMCTDGPNPALEVTRCEVGIHISESIGN